jgi:hypothetical protein
MKKQIKKSVTQGVLLIILCGCSIGFVFACGALTGAYTTIFKAGYHWSQRHAPIWPK